MKRQFVSVVWITILSLLLFGCSGNQNYKASIKNDLSIEISHGGEKVAFLPEFTILYSDTDPSLKLRPAGIEHVSYNIPTWINQESESELKLVKRDIAQQGDGFDDSVLEGESQKRTPNLYHGGRNFKIIASDFKIKGNTITFTFPDHEFFTISATLITSNKYPELVFDLRPKMDGYFSVGYTGAPSFDVTSTNEIWQPIIWQEKRFPSHPIMTLAFRCPIPSALVEKEGITTGVLAHPNEFPFDPLPLLDNSRFGIAVHNADGSAQAQLFAPVLGGVESKMEVGDRFEFSMYLLTEEGSIDEAFEHIARDYFGFKDYRRNEIGTLNETLDNIVDYTHSDFSLFNIEQKGCAYSTDVPGAVKNVSSLNPLELALVLDDEKMFQNRAYPIIEYMLSREKFLFCLDSAQKIQHPSRKMTGPIAPVTELVSLYNIFDKRNSFLTDLAKKEYSGERIRNLDVAEEGQNWKNALAIYRATGEDEFLQLAIEGADEYIKNRVEKPQTDFSDPTSGGTFFWTGFAPKWIDLLELYEITKDKRFLDAAHQGARQYTRFTWMSPRIPDENITVNKGGKAPLYWYLKSKGHKQMYFPEETVPAWRLSEIGLTPESSGTCNGHRAIFMANYAPWMLRVGHYTEDKFLQEVAKSAIIGRYLNFPGYHINTARTTAYEKADYPLRDHYDLSINSFHYNHIMPMASMLIDYLVTDAFIRSNGAIDFPSEFIEGYAYLQSKFYGHKAGKFYDDEDVRLWMPKGLLETSHVELNYIAAINDQNLYLAFINQSNSEVTSEITLNTDLVPLDPAKTYKVKIWKDNKTVSAGRLKDGKTTLSANANGITAICIEEIKVQPKFQNKILSPSNKMAWSKDFIEDQDFEMRAMVLNVGDGMKTAYIYLQADDSKFKSVSLSYKGADNNEDMILDNIYPYEFTIPLLDDQNEFGFQLSGVKVDGSKITSGKFNLHK